MGTVLGRGASRELGQGVGVDAHEVPGDGPVAEIVAEINRVVADARGRDLAGLAAIDECDVCEDAYPLEALFESTRAAVSVCPCCAFDGDLVDPDPVHLAFQIDRAAAESLTVPAGWAAVQALLCCLAGPDLLVLLRHEWRAAEIPYLPSQCWGDVLTTWIWLPPAPRRSAALVDLGCGASLGRVIAAIDQVHPGLRAACRARLDEADHASLADEYGDDLGDERSAAQDSMRIPDGTFDRMWPAVVAYTVAMLTQQAERPHRTPWHVLESFELAEWCHAVGSDLNVWDVERLLYHCIIVIRDALDPRDPGWDDYR